MPTSHPRHAVTETEEISDALAVARRTWPELADKPGALLRRLILEGRNTLVYNSTEEFDERRRAVVDTGGALSGVFRAGYLEDLREDWPE
ncbi:hypothetical protein QGN32_16020 [Mycolicibacterium sp. ND9-15]|uniref:hypothetical protein n=1 Tax=Mycolicibacterium sp. ND9-15 TaxID=3042320 RepID=UPI002DD92188|nr:hypothetical protein [Mycolicibacterium sp. ND9-15]WSE54966.1 hypothetical protein QGN32_16020 [Mycolicibacterium sp. ND9-15]